MVMQGGARLFVSAQSVSSLLFACWVMLHAFCRLRDAFPN